LENISTFFGKYFNIFWKIFQHFLAVASHPLSPVGCFAREGDRNGTATAKKKKIKNLFQTKI
jgi:hypothetical protein